MVIDGEVVIAGSFNFTSGAEASNAENMLVIRSAEIAANYERNCQEHLGRSVPQERRE
jgi:phosphatidylserine/phosphatidylglycerophosphate/cardiolipin synthase-like enzyme